jgi:hypothetical protein
VSALLVKGLTLDFSGSYNTAVINDPSANAIAAGITPGTRVLSVPKYSANLGLSYTPQITETMNGLLNVSNSWVGTVRDQAAYPQILPAYYLLDARAGVSSGPWGAYLYGTNLTNKEAALTINNTIFAWQTYAITRVSTNQPRTIGLDFQYKF